MLRGEERHGTHGGGAAAAVVGVPAPTGTVTSLGASAAAERLPVKPVKSGR